MKKFYKMVSCAKKSGGYEIHLDGKPVKTPSGKILQTPYKALAEEVAREWQGQEDEIKPDTMPVTQILTTEIERISAERGPITKAVLAYLHTDLLCYRAIEPEAVAKAQAEAWDQWLNWFKEHFGAALQTTCGLAALQQDDVAGDAVARYIEGLDNTRFNILQLVTSLSGSLVLALAFLEGAITGEALFDACYVEEHYKSVIYNEKKHGFAPQVEKQMAALRRDLTAARLCLSCLN